FADGQFIAEAADRAMPLVVTGAAAIKPLVGAECRVIGFGLARVVIQVFRILVISQEIEPMRISLLGANGKTVEAGAGIVGGGQDARIESGVWQALDNRSGAEIRLILIPALGKLAAAAAGIGELDQ